MSHVSLVTKCFILNINGELLILKRSNKAIIRPGDWDLPGGMVEDKENPNEAITREILEETGITSRSSKLVFVSTEQSPAYILTFFYVTHVENDIVKISTEHTDYQWISVNEFLKLNLPKKFTEAVAFLEQKF